MSTIIDTIEATVRRFRAAATRRDENQIDRQLSVLQRELLATNVYRSIWDERLLAEADELMTAWLDPAQHSTLEGLRGHLEVVRDAHDKIFAVLSPDISLEELIFQHLFRWSQLDEPLSLTFDTDDLQTLQGLRVTGTTKERPQKLLSFYLQRLAAAGHEKAVGTVRPAIEGGLNAYERAYEKTVYALFASGGRGEVRGITIQARNGSGSIHALDRVDEDMEKAARRALETSRAACPQIRAYDFTWDIARDDISFAGESIGLALSMGLLAKAEGWDIDPYTAFTGHIDWTTGAVRRIDYLPEKLAAAQSAGIRRVFISIENLADCPALQRVQVVPVGSVTEVRDILRRLPAERANTPLEQMAVLRINQLTIGLRDHEIHQVSCVQRDAYCKRVTFTDFQTEVYVDVFHGKKGLNPQVQPQDSKLREMVLKVCDEIFEVSAVTAAQPSNNALPATRKYQVSDRRLQQQIEHHLFQRPDAVRETAQSCVYRAKIIKARQTVFVHQYTNGTLTVQGPAPLIDEVDAGIRSLLGIAPNQVIHTPQQERLAAQIRAVEEVQLGDEWIGTDEAGKGDYFGPLVGAAVLADQETAQQLEQLGVKDSKQLSDRRVAELAEQIRKVCGARASVVPLTPDVYNKLYAEFQVEGKNLNTLLAWVHARALENLLQKFPRPHITVIIDKFADERYIQSKLLAQGRRTRLDLKQLPKAEVNIAVAAASILARAQFLEFLSNLSRTIEIVVPKGSSDPRIVEVGRTMITRYGDKYLEKVAKLHFKTTADIRAKK